MTEKLVKLLVITLGILIIFAFIALIYGMYYKISSKSFQREEYPKDISIILDKYGQIENFQIIDENRILITIRDNSQLIGLIYDINNEKIIQKISK